MKNNRKIWTGFFAAAGLILLILDPKTALAGTREGIELCLYTVIPSLFPFFVFSTLLNNSLTGNNLPFLRPIGKLCGIPQGAESIMFLGILGGYPVGAQMLNNAYIKKSISKDNAQRLVGFCNNAGPSFIFGMAGSLFDRSVIPLAIWLIQILSAIIVGMVIPKGQSTYAPVVSTPKITLAAALERSIKTMGNICGWVVLFRALCVFCVRWFLWVFPDFLQVAAIGILELSNGCFALKTITLGGTRFLLSCGMLSFGGLCVAMQTVSVTKDCGIGMYFPGKFLQTSISLLLAFISQPILFAPQERCLTPMWSIITLLIGAVISLLLLRKRKIVVEIL